jgi:hypothetical protein
MIRALMPCELVSVTVSTLLPSLSAPNAPRVAVTDRAVIGMVSAAAQNRPVIHSARFIRPSRLASDSSYKSGLCDHIVGQYASSLVVGHASSERPGTRVAARVSMTHCSEG